MASEQDGAGEFEQNVPEDITNKEETRQIKSTKFSGYIMHFIKVLPLVL